MKVTYLYRSRKEMLGLGLHVLPTSSYSRMYMSSEKKSFDLLWVKPLHKYTLINCEFVGF